MNIYRIASRIVAGYYSDNADLLAEQKFDESQGRTDDITLVLDEAGIDNREQISLDSVGFDDILRSINANDILEYAETKATEEQIPALWSTIIHLWDKPAIISFMDSELIKAKTSNMFKNRMEDNWFNMYGESEEEDKEEDKEEDNGPKMCTSCNGLGEDPWTERMCKSCRGSGEVPREIDGPEDGSNDYYDFYD